MSELSSAIQALANTLAELNIAYTAYTHPPLHTCTDADELGLVRSGTRLKNLFLRDNYGRQHFLLLVPASFAVDLKALSKQQAISRLGFASPERLEKYLGVKPGCVSALALANDPQGNVQLWVERSLWEAQQWQCHPFHNEQTWVLNKDDLHSFFKHTGHAPEILDVPTL